MVIFEIVTNHMKLIRTTGTSQIQRMNLSSDRESELGMRLCTGFNRALSEAHVLEELLYPIYPTGGVRTVLGATLFHGLVEPAQQLFLLRG